MNNSEYIPTNYESTPVETPRGVMSRAEMNSAAARAFGEATMNAQSMYDQPNIPGVEVPVRPLTREQIRGATVLEIARTTQAVYGMRKNTLDQSELGLAA